jgi:hypothetical protein
MDDQSVLRSPKLLTKAEASLPKQIAAHRVLVHTHAVPALCRCVMRSSSLITLYRNAMPCFQL